MFVLILIFINRGYAPFRRAWAEWFVCLLESFLRCFGLQVGGLGSKLEAWEALLASILDLLGVWEAKGAPGKGSRRAWVGPGVAGGPDLGPTWPQLEPSWSHVGAIMVPT